MTTNESAEGMEGFHRSLLECVEDINALLPGLSHRYDMPVIIDAMAEHVGAAMQALLRKKLCDTRHANLMIRQLEGAAFLGQPPQAPAQTGAGEAPDAPPPGKPPKNSTPE